MKIIHTSDWELGKFVNEFSMIEEQERVLKKFLKFVEKEKPEAIIFSGNFYNRFWPTREAIALLDKILNTIIVDMKIKFLGILGDSDDPNRVIFGSSILEEQGLYLVGKKGELYKKVTLFKDEERVNVYLIPYKTPGEIAEILDEKNIDTYNRGIDFIINKIKGEGFNNKEVNIAVYHGFVGNKEGNPVAYSEAGLDILSLDKPISFEGEDIISKELFCDFDYVALGHLHKQQQPFEKIFYSGSLEKYSFEEENIDKTINIVEISKDKIVTVSKKRIGGLRNFKSIEISKEDLEEKISKKSYDFFNITIKGRVDGLNLLKEIRRFYPNIMILNREGDLEARVKEDITFKNLGVIELFEEYYKEYGSEVYSDEKKKLIKHIAYKSLRKEEHK